jgi:FAD:protein FMN transferase
MSDTSHPPLRRFNHRAMATVFEFVIFEDSVADAQAASQAAFEQIDQLEQKLSYFIPSSDINQINMLSAGRGVIVSVDTFACLQIANDIHMKTGGAFDPTVGCLLTERKPWDTQEDVPRGRKPRPLGEQINLGFRLLALDTASRTVTALVDDVRLDLGAIGKGFALDLAAETMRDYGITSALLSAGQSTMLPIGLPPGQDSWMMRLRDPRDETTILGRVALRTGGLSTSSIAKDAHILNPTDGEPVQATIGAWALAPTAAESDALSTAFMVMPPDAVHRYCHEHPPAAAGTFSSAGEFVPTNLPLIP